ncbi:unnamed protein product, partial [Ectocarpus sp. 13 AM-2016]
NESGEETWVHRIFQGVLTNQTKCLCCETVRLFVWRLCVSITSLRYDGVCFWCGEITRPELLPSVNEAKLGSCFPLDKKVHPPTPLGRSQVSNRDEPFMDLSLDVEQNSSVSACLRNFSSTETLTRKNKFFCETCYALQEAEKKIRLKRLPRVL